MATNAEEGRADLLKGLEVVPAPAKPPETEPEPKAPEVAPETEPEPEPEPQPDELAQLGLRGEDGKLDERRVAEAARMARGFGGLTSALEAEARESPEACAAVVRAVKRLGLTQLPQSLADIEAGHKGKTAPAAAAAEEDEAAVESKALAEAQACLAKNDAVGALRVTMRTGTSLGERRAKKMFEEAQRRIETQGRQRSAEESAHRELREVIAKHPEIAAFDGSRLQVKDQAVFDHFAQQALIPRLSIDQAMENALKLAGRSERKPDARSKGRPAITGGGTAPATLPPRVPGKAQMKAEVVRPDE